MGSKSDGGRKQDTEHSSPGNWDNFGTISLEVEKRERRVIRKSSGKVDESGSGTLECEMLKEGRDEITSRQMSVYLFIHFL